MNNPEFDDDDDEYDNGFKDTDILQEGNDNNFEYAGRLGTNNFEDDTGTQSVQ